ncbi:hypothetical protein [Haloferula sp. A504]|uniref:hypothetical protein n=1 Tax=Haloferula sp. A504 TaxID=3373601 RepID=UPI0031BDD228|nr:hypothetical protein [Verrucomicrobiaceae bacterium E54]
MASGIKAFLGLIAVVLLLGTLAYASYRLIDSFRRDAAGPGYGYVVDDLPEGGRADGDYWRSGEFLGFRADRIRRLAESKGSSFDEDSLRFFARLPMSDRDFRGLLGRLQASEDSSFRSLETPDYSGLFLMPEWFPTPEYAVHSSRCRDEAGWRVLVIRGSDGFTYLHLN